MARCRLRIDGLDCAVEAATLRTALAQEKGVSALDFDFMSGIMEVEFDEARISPLTLVARINRNTRMRAEWLVDAPVPGPDMEPSAAVASGRARSRPWIFTAASGACVAVGQILTWTGRLPVVANLLFALAIILAGFQLVPLAWRSLRLRQLDIHVLMSLAVAGALVLGQWDEGATVAFLFLLSESIESMTVERARRAVRAMLEVAPETAELVEPGGTTSTVAAAAVRAGQRVLVRAGDRVPVDGLVIAGRSSVDQKMITGESIPVLREEGDEVFAGTVNGEGTLEVEALRPIGDAVVTRIIERVRAAQRGRTPIEQTIDRFARIYTPIVCLLAIAVMVLPPLLQSGASWRWWFHQGLVLLVIACPCALVIATPVAIVGALAAATRRGILIKSGEFLEAASHLRVLAFDKTGTLTRGEPDVVEVVARAGSEDTQVMRVAAAVGDRGAHVLGRAIAKYVRQLRIEIPVAEEYQAVPGMGAHARVESERYHIGSHRYIDESGLCRPDFHAELGRTEESVGTSVIVSDSERPLGWVRLADRPRQEAARALADLRSLDVQPFMLTGDNAATAAAIARELGISDFRGGLMPEEKARLVAQLQAERGDTGMVGDGVNDAPALAAARVSIAMGGVGSGVALETADIVLMGDDLLAVPWLIRLSRRALSTIRANMALAIGAKLVFMLLAVFGVANLWMAIAADLGVSLLVVGNALRLLRAK